MITASPRRAQPARWQQLWREAVSEPHELLSLVGLSHLSTSLLPAARIEFPMRVPRGFVARMRYGDPADPLLLQVLPQAAELLRDVPGFSQDAVGDMASRSAHGVLHKYHGRALLIATGSCAVHCRYCFRQHFPYNEHTAAANQWREAIEHVREDSSISEVLLSGGDPLSLSTAKLIELSTAFATIPHLRRLRIHTRLPVVLPERVDAELLDWIAQLTLPCVIVLHANHANELDAAVATACMHLRQAGATLLNQSVLLRGINDNEAALSALSERLIECGIQPYYLHQLDRVVGTAHFEVSDSEALALIETLRRRLPGYLVPQLVREVAGAPYKLPLAAIA
jgi:EF-P beta-lysylation protein EpmB